ncbi:MAG: transcription antitermination factor NusB, partial [Paraeggerthella sp.]|nr:transcription antitermination factor NusB [Paraeggerthella sp.]
MPDRNKGSQDRRAPKGYAGPVEKPRESRASRSKASPARLAALDVVRTVRERGAFAQDVIGKRIDGSSLSPEDRSFATLLALGVVSSVGTLDDVLDRALSKPTDVQPDVRDALRLSVYEIIFLNKTPHAAVDQGVELVRSFAPRAAGLANAVLRKVVVSRASFPFGDPTRDVEALARLHAFPVWLARKLVLDLGPQAALDFMRASNEPAPLFVAANAAKTDEAAVAAAFAKAGESTQPVEIDGVPVPGCLRVKDN